MTAGKRKQSGSMLSVVETETEKRAIDQVAVGHGGFVLGSGLVGGTGAMSFMILLKGEALLLDLLLPV